MVTKRGKAFYLRIRPFGAKEVGVKTPARSKTEAKQIEMAVMTACGSGDYRSLSPSSRETCVRMFRNQRWEIPPDLMPEEPVKDDLTIWKAVEMFVKYPEIRRCRERERYEQCIVHLVEHFGKERPVKSIWVPDIKRYMTERLENGVSPSTVNREKGTLSKVLQVLVEHRLIEANPCRLVKNMSQKSEERQVYLSLVDVNRIVNLTPPWFRSIAQTAFYTGMRRGEILGLTRDQVNLGRRLLYLGPRNTKEGRWKRVPIHRELVPILEETMRIQSLLSDRFFLCDGKPPHPSSLKGPWGRAVIALELDPKPRFHDFRHTWKTNARRSGMDPEIRESIMGHWFRGRSVNERYGRIGDEELLEAIDSMRFDHGETEILVARN